ncbi:MAG: HD-GYP domain-containing protein [Syntrophomonas sp.]|uniref:HD-GYP domain-containing protein n=1 Tax=Syntrophomonas sp. TaxID=2053627 RepID=UPI00261BC242|nr:HD-GYP domain-containing protein [Syntrophomonas sp.]MDD2511329.1 HD-GYP domain-containing protein [Syntrophomonas sp.]MDD3879426.1 HD-GYP domain-containing protein [Syntrophomonas sp.]MDD4627443.1 HD-GYP domain-containing protein [Syntrophomonas sp.]
MQKRILNLNNVIKQLFKLPGQFIKTTSSSNNEELLIIARTLLRVVDLIDHYTCSHSLRVASLADCVAVKMGLRAELRKTLHDGALLHDVGKIGVGKHILCKEGPLSDDEWLLLKRHAIIGYEALENMGYSEGVLSIVRHHHEHYDGKGYPDGLKGGEIPFLARIISVADSFDAMTTRRPYHSAYSTYRALEEIKQCSGSQFDPEVAAAFNKIII